MSSTLIYGHEPRLLPWACERIGIGQFARDAFTIGLERGGKLVAVVVFDRFTDCDCHMHVASDGSRHWLNKELLLAAFAYPFTQLGFRRVTSLIPASNSAALKFNQHLGFSKEGYHRHAMPDGDIIALGLLRADCKFIIQEKPHG